MANTLRICLAALTALLLIAPTSVEARPIALAWDANPEPAVTGYTLSYGIQPGVYTTSVNVGNLISYMIDLPGVQYYFVIRAYTAAGLTSPMSSEVAESSAIALTNPGTQSDAAGFNVSLQLAATGTPVSYTATNLPGGLSINASTGRITGIISSGAAASSPYLVSASVSNAAGNKSSVQFTWAIVANNAPSLTSPGNRTSAASATISLQLAATDPDGDVLTYSATGLPPGLTVNGSTGLISGTLSSTAGTYSVTATASDGLLTNSKTFTWTVTGVSGAPTVTNLAPASGPVGTSVTITGTNFGATKGTSTITFNGITGAPATWTATSIGVPVPAGATTGNVVVTVGGLASNSASFTVVTPSSLPAPWTAQDVGSPALAGSASATATTFSVTGSGVDIWGTSDQFQFVYQPLNGDGEIVARVDSLTNVNAWAKAGVMIREDLTPGAPHALAYVSPGAGTIFSRRVTRGGASTSTSSTAIAGTAPYWVRLARSGNTFTAYASSTGTPWVLMGSITVPMATQAYVGLAVTSHDATLVTTGGFSNVTVTNTTTAPTPPSITGQAPTSGAVGASVTVSGANFGTTKGTSTLTFNGMTATPTTWAATNIAVPVPAGATTGNVVVTVGGMASNGVAFTVMATAPSVTSLAPTSGMVGASVTITGANFGSTKGTSTVTFNGITAMPATWTATSIGVPVPAGATSGNIVVTVGGLASNGVAFTVMATPTAPTVTSLSPTSAAVGASVTITGTNFGATKGTSTITFNGVTGAPSTWTATSIAVPVPAGATTGNVVVTVGGLASNGMSFTVMPTSTVPTVTSLAPTSGAVGASVTIAGTNFGSPQGTSTITFNGVTGAPTTWTATSIAVLVPAGATTGNVIVTVGGIASNAVAFTVTTPGTWTNQDIGSPSVAGSATVTSGTFSVTGGGADIWGASDQFQYVFQPLNGDGEIVARVDSLASGNAWAKAGVMIREDLTPGAPNAMAYVSSGQGMIFSRRVTRGGASTSTSSTAIAGAAPYWVRLVRSGNTFSAYASSTGTAWVLMGSINVTMASQAYIGLAVNSHDVTVATTGTFSNVTVTP